MRRVPELRLRRLLCDARDGMCSSRVSSCGIELRYASPNQTGVRSPHGHTSARITLHFFVVLF